MPQKKTAAIILAAGKGTRMKSALTKVLHPVGGRPMIGHVLATAAAVKVDETVVVISKDGNAIAQAVAPVATVVQEEQLGTGHSARAGISALEGFAGDVVVLYGDCPLVRPVTIQAMLDMRSRDNPPSVIVLGFRPDDPAEYGRLVLSSSGDLEAIVEFGEADEGERAIGLCNSGTLLLGGESLALMERIGNDNAKGEYYLTDIVELARAEGLRCAVVEGESQEVLGVNSRAELSVSERVFQTRMREAAMDAGATLKEPESTYFSYDTRLGRDVVIGPNVVFGPNVIVEDSVTIEAFCHIEGAHIASGARIGPFARLRPGSDIGEDAKIGNFVEVKKATIEEGAKVSHLSYIGDARIGAESNIGAGTITCNYDGFNKHFTDIGEGVFIGSNTALVAPVKVGDGAMVGAGSTISKDVPDDALAVTRADEKHLEGAAARFRRKHAKDK